ncbi:uncharacterized protein SPAPADRAFT_48476 [Spathaspora passalidarum NRRL Y-27907]|uniref:Clathrin/coatomer adaptor adaptin-like N-terminal domain-containing protein n=1 Tax=Spathaspora passalidarum (strain NRRL Y-27907 / 11-Y1) TaxID=619300 RepID=G3AH58_SPAPN|nr:uncharacterized protein SPAPADRAFT_48476 [Spathaspora passalidarum NRRL Y-27907]EGW35488.1 hypothetical protein SPAPADRAFT_48476 [Spathaspora passalidarum NRRL Y-27907]
MADSFSKISSMIESAKELTIEAAVSASARLTDTPSALRPQEISKLLNSRIDREILNGMKCVISLISRGEDGLPYFADVVKNVTNSNVKVRQLVLIYLTKYAEAEPDTALLAVNSIQRSLNDKNPVSRANSIRSLSGIRISSIIPILMVCIKRTSKDHSPLVRSATAISIGKAYSISRDSKKQLVEHLTDLLADSDAVVVSSAIKTYYKIRADLGSETKIWAPIHGNFRRFCNLLSQFDEWSQSLVIDLLTEYSRKFLPRPKLYSKDGQILDFPDDISQIPFQDYDVSFDEDLQLFLDSMKSLTFSSSENVILSLAKSVYLLAPPITFKDFHLDKILVRIGTAYDDSQVSLSALQTIALISEKDKMLSPFYKKFYVMPSDSTKVANSKLNILSTIAIEDNFKYILEELKYYALHYPNNEVKKEAIRAIGKCSQISPAWSTTILKWCLARIKDANGETLNELLKVVRYLIQQKSESRNSEDKEAVLKTSYRMSLILQDPSVDLEDDAKASIIWTIGEYSDLQSGSFASDILRILLKSFVNESEPVRYQILVLACKIFSYELIKLKNESGDNNQDYVNEKLSNSVEYKMFQHALQLAKYDSSYDTRDRARMFNVLLNTGTNQAQLACLFLQVPKSVPFINASRNDDTDDVMSTKLHEYFTATEWTSDTALIPPASIREEVPVKNVQNPAFFSSSNDNRRKSPSPVPVNAISSDQFVHGKTQTTSAPKTPYQLQSLDEFFGSEESSSEEIMEESEDSDDSEEEVSDEELESEEEEEVEKKSKVVKTVENSDDEESSDESSSDADSTKGFI